MRSKFGHARERAPSEAAGAPWRSVSDGRRKPSVPLDPVEGGAARIAAEHDFGRRAAEQRNHFQIAAAAVRACYVSEIRVVRVKFPMPSRRAAPGNALNGQARNP